MLKLEDTTNSWLCDACDRAPAAFFCKADAASLCCACDVDIHSANPLASRHHRVSIVPETTPYGEGVAAASWLLLKTDPTSFCSGVQVVDEFLDLDNNQFNENPFNIINHHQQHYNRIRGCDSVVPTQQQLGSSDKNDESCSINNAPYNYSASISHSVSLSHLDIGIVPESTTMSENSIAHPGPPKGTIDHFSGPLIQIPTQLSPMDREARVLRYREKKKARKFEKTIRYASRKAYAETRPRIKGRFAKRTGVAEVEVDQMFSTSVIAESGYGIVPSF